MNRPALDPSLGENDCVVHALGQFPDPALLHRAHPRRYPHLLESTAQGTAQARYDILFAFPGSSLVLASDRRLWLDGARIGGDFLTALDRLWCVEATAPDLSAGSIPFTGGWFLYLGYELARDIEPVLASLPTDGALPLAVATRFPAALIRDHAHGQAFLVSEREQASALIPAMIEDVRDCRQAPSSPIDVLDVREEDPSLHVERIARALDYIRAGDVFQANLSRTWKIELRTAPLACDLYVKLRHTNPAPFAGLANIGHEQAIISSSPERLVCVRGDRISTRPIAGTSPRSRDPAEDDANSRRLARNPKERAEHIMLIDLARNDLGRICRPGTVQVSETMQVTSYRHVHHLESDVEGRLRADVRPGAVIRAMFPGGTITGCPKLRTQQIIAELERAPRGAYTGSMGYLNRNGDMDVNILIRTLVLDGRHLLLRAGGGIVADSQPLRELDETRAKAKGLLAVFGPA